MYRGMLWKLVAQLSPFFLACLLDTSYTDMYAVDIP